MKNLAHCFSREIISSFLESRAKTSGRNFELMAALMMQRLYEKQWNMPTVIGYYMSQKYHHELLKNGPDKNPALWLDALENGIDQRNPIDFIIASVDETSCQEFQLKRFGMRNEPQDANALFHYLNAMKNKYARMDAACLVAVPRFDLINWPKVRDHVDKQSFPFSELLLIGVVGDQFLIAGILPEEGWSAFYLSEVVN